MLSHASTVSSASSLSEAHGAVDLTFLTDLADEPTPSCEEPLDTSPTPADRIGPYYTPGAPFRTSLVEEETPGTRLVIRGRVRGTRRKGAQGPLLGGAVLDVWQADAAGEYDNTGFRLRGRFVADDSGCFCIETILPGRYLDGDGYRPRHLHVIVSAEGHASVTTQIYFAGDPFNAGDVGFKESLMIAPAEGPSGLEASFDFVLGPAS